MLMEILRGITQKAICVYDKEQIRAPAKEQWSWPHSSSLQPCYPVNTFHSLLVVITEAGSSGEN